MKLRDLSAKQIMAIVCVIAVIVILASAVGASAQGIGGLINDAAQNNAVELLDLAIKVIGFVVGVILTFATSKLPGKWRNEAQAALAAKEAELRQALHQAARSGIEDGAKQGLTGAALVLHGMKHVVTSVPDSIVELTPTPAELLKAATPQIVLDRLPDGVRGVIERIVRSKIDPLAEALRDAGAPA